MGCIKPTSPAKQDGFLTTRPPEKSQKNLKEVLFSSSSAVKGLGVVERDQASEPRRVTSAPFQTNQRLGFFISQFNLYMTCSKGKPTLILQSHNGYLQPKLFKGQGSIHYHFQSWFCTFFHQPNSEISVWDIPGLSTVHWSKNKC